MRKLAEKIKNSFSSFRTLLRKYDENIESVDPQLKNNADLVEALNEFESYWSKGKNYFVVPRKCNQLLHFTNIIEITSEKYQTFKEQVQDRDTLIFVVIPALLLLKNLDDDDKGLCKTFFPPLFGEPLSAQDEEDPSRKQMILDSQLKYKALVACYKRHLNKATNSYDYYNLIEKALLDMEEDSDLKKITQEDLLTNDLNKDELLEMLQHLRVLSMHLQRYNPMEWNEFLDVSLENE